MLNQTGSGRHASATPRWSGEQMLQIAYRLNERCFALLAQAVPTERAQFSFNGVFASPALWAQVDDRAARRAARCPVLLLDLNFRRPEWWSYVRTARTNHPQVAKAGSLFVTESATTLLREILIEARSFARTMPRAVGFVFGMTPQVGEIIAELSIADIDRIAGQQLHDLQPRWKKCRTFWDRLLQSALDGNDEALTAVHLHAIQLLGGECLAPVVEARASTAPRGRSLDPTVLALAPIVIMNPSSKEPI